MSRIVAIVFIVTVIFGIAIAFFIKNPHSRFNSESISQDSTSQSDLSYIYINTYESVDVQLVDSANKNIGEVLMEEPTKNSSSSAVDNLMVKGVYYDKPNSGMYYANFTSDNDYLADFYLYDKNGEVVMRRIEGSGAQKYKIDFDKESAKESTISSQR